MAGRNFKVSQTLGIIFKKTTDVILHEAYKAI
jgi:hypothetical protein